jgi:hypothetical protein
MKPHQTARETEREARRKGKRVAKRKLERALDEEERDFVDNKEIKTRNAEEYDRDAYVGRMKSPPG